MLVAAAFAAPVTLLLKLSPEVSIFPAAVDAPDTWIDLACSAPPMIDDMALCAAVVVADPAWDAAVVAMLAAWAAPTTV